MLKEFIKNLLKFNKNKQKTSDEILATVLEDTENSSDSKEYVHRIKGNKFSGLIEKVNLNEDFKK